MLVDSELNKELKFAKDEDFCLFFDFPFKSLPTVGGKGLIDLYGEN